MRIAANADLAISADTMHQYVTGPTALKTMMRMLLDELDKGAISVHSYATEASVSFRNISLLSGGTPSWMTKLRISSPPSTITRITKSGAHHNDPSVSGVLHGFLKTFCLTWVHVQIVCNVLSSVSSSVDSGCNSHRVDEKS